MNTLRQAVQEYLAMRRSLGFKLHAGPALLDFVSFLEAAPRLLYHAPIGAWQATYSPRADNPIRGRHSV